MARRSKKKKGCPCGYKTVGGKKVRYTSTNSWEYGKTRSYTKGGKKVCKPCPKKGTKARWAYVTGVSRTHTMCTGGGQSWAAAHAKREARRDGAPGCFAAGRTCAEAKKAAIAKCRKKYPKRYVRRKPRRG